MTTIKIIDVATGEVTERQKNDEELQDVKNRKLEVLNEETEILKTITAKAAAQAKLAALGLTTDDLKALGLGGN